MDTAGVPPPTPRGPHTGRSRPPPQHPGQRCHGHRVTARNRWPIPWRTSGHASKDACARLLAAPQAGADQRGSQLRAGTAAAGRTALPSSYADGHGRPFQTPRGEQLPAPQATHGDAVPAGHGRWTWKSRLLTDSEQRGVGNREGTWGHVLWGSKTAPGPKGRDPRRCS